MRNAHVFRSVAAALLLASLGGCADMRFWDRHHHGSQARMSAVDLNNANPRQLANLPGLNDQDAERIVRNRPYNRKRDLVDRNIIGPKQFEQISDYVYVGGQRSSER